MTRTPAPSGSTPAPEYGELQQLVNELSARKPSGYVTKLEAIEAAVVNLLPGGRYKRGPLCDQMNSIITAHGWSYVYGTVE